MKYVYVAYGTALVDAINEEDLTLAQAMHLESSVAGAIKKYAASQRMPIETVLADASGWAKYHVFPAQEEPKAYRVWFTSLETFYLDVHADNAAEAVEVAKAADGSEFEACEDADWQWSSTSEANQYKSK